jgi:NAD-dependent dihydropyrimidine dehydrogenase PreA subunit
MALFKAEKKAPRGPAGRWDVVIGEEMCKACGFCLNVCPVDVFAWRTATNKLGWFPMYVAHEEHCVGCMLCYQICPDFCIDVAVRALQRSKSDAPSGEPSPSMMAVVENGGAN